MSETGLRAGIPAAFQAFPGAVLQLSRGGVVLDTNGRLERELGQRLTGRPFAEVLDADSSLEKWERILATSAGEMDDGETVWELILRGPETLLEPLPFSVLWDDEADLFWLVEHRHDPRLDQLSEALTGVNSELANTQRELLKERGRLAYALEEIQARGEELERSNRALDEFAHVVSHDLKAPLRSIASYAEWVEEEEAERLGEESRAHLSRLRNRVDRMRTMIDGVLAYARAGRKHARPEPVDVGDLLREVVELLGPPDGVAVEVEPAMPTLRTERAPLRQVFLNLVGNALRYAQTSRTPRVSVSVREAGAFQEFSVADNGPGIPPRLQEKVWTLFHTLEPEEQAEGTGIGLAIVKKLVEAHGGRVWVDSEEGAGATFRFLWPIDSGERT